MEEGVFSFFVFMVGHSFYIFTVIATFVFFGR